MNIYPITPAIPFDPQAFNAKTGWIWHEAGAISPPYLMPRGYFVDPFAADPTAPAVLQAFPYVARSSNYQAQTSYLFQDPPGPSDFLSVIELPDQLFADPWGESDNVWRIHGTTQDWVVLNRDVPAYVPPWSADTYYDVVPEGWKIADNQIYSAFELPPPHPTVVRWELSKIDDARNSRVVWIWKETNWWGYVLRWRAVSTDPPPAPKPPHLNIIPLLVALAIPLMTLMFTGAVNNGTPPGRNRRRKLS